MLTPRQQFILNAIVEDYVRLAEPVGSRALSKHDNINYSPATIRNEMADLEELGYLDQPHASAGRIPSQKGYRFYVDNLMRERARNTAMAGELKSLFQTRLDEVERVIQQTSSVLSNLTQQTSIVLGPQMQRARVRKLELIPLSPQRAVAILVTDSGHVQDRQVHLPEDISVDDIAYIVNVFNDKLQGVLLSDLKTHLYQEIVRELAKAARSYEDVMILLDDVIGMGEDAERVYVGGTVNMLSQPEFRDVDKVRPLIALLETAELAGQLLPREIGMQVRIGSENQAKPLTECTVISTTYALGGIPVGYIGIIGPTRMDYAGIVQVLDYTSISLTKLLTDWTNTG